MFGLDLWFQRDTSSSTGESQPGRGAKTRPSLLTLNSKNIKNVWGFINSWWHATCWFLMLRNLLCFCWINFSTWMMDSWIDRGSPLCSTFGRPSHTFSLRFFFLELFGNEKLDPSLGWLPTYCWWLHQMDHIWTSAQRIFKKGYRCQPAWQNVVEKEKRSWRSNIGKPEENQRFPRLQRSQAQDKNIEQSNTNYFGNNKILTTSPKTLTKRKVQQTTS